ncbi:AP2 domain-containing protein [Clostridium perfringens]|nr:AP2 domain-containing protein [Clostridium perfringens]
MGNNKDLIGKTFGNLTVIEPSEKRTSSRAILYRCRCVCGNETFVSSSSLKSGHSKSCGCERKKSLKKYNASIRKDLTNKKFGRLTAIKEIGKDKHGNILWECKCSCGNRVNVTGLSLLSGNTTSCGCVVIDKLKKESKKNLLEGTNIAIIENLLKNSKSNRTASGVKGVGWDKKSNKWRAYIMFKNKSYHLGYFVYLKDAIKARKKAEERLFKPFLESLKEE